MKKTLFALLIIFYHLGFSQNNIKVKAPVSDLKVKVWANTAIISVFDYDYKNMVAKRKESAQYFSSDGWLAFNKAFNASGIKQIVEKQRYTVSAVATRPPQIKEQGLKSGKYYWQVDMPVFVLYKGDSKQRAQHLDITVNILYQPERTGFFSYVSNLKIKDFNATEGSPLACPKGLNLSQ